MAAGRPDQIPGGYHGWVGKRPAREDRLLKSEDFGKKIIRVVPDPTLR
jgi:hypothetical protein